MVLTSKIKLFSLTFNNNISKVWTLILYRTENNLSNFCVIINENKKKMFRFNRMRLFHFKEKPTTPLRHRGKTMKKHMFQWKKLIYNDILLTWKLLKHLWTRKKMGKYIHDATHLTEELQNYPYLMKNEIRDTKKETGRKMLMEQFLMVFLWTIRDQAIHFERPYIVLHYFR